MSEGQGIIVGQVSLQPADLQQAIEESPRRRGTRVLALLMLVGFAVLVVVAISTQGQSFRWVNAIPSAVAVLGILAAAFWGSRLAAKKTVEGEREVATTYAFEASGFGISSAESSTRAEWSTLHHWEEGPSAFLLYVNEHLPYVVPKRAFQDADLPRVRALMVTHVGKRGERRARKGVLTARQRTIIKWIVLMVALFLLRAFVRNQ